MLLQHGGDGDRSVEMERRQIPREAGELDENPEKVPYLRAGFVAAIFAGIRRRR